MTIKIIEYTEEWIGAVKDFNKRLRDRRCRYQFPELTVSMWLPRIENRRIYQEYFIAVDEGIVRGGYILKPQEFLICGKERIIASYQLPLSEAIVDRKYAGVGTLLMENALSKQKFLYTLGIGGRNHAAARFLEKKGWSRYIIPFYFRVVHPSKFLRNITYLRNSFVRKLMLDFLSYSGLGWLGVNFRQGFSMPDRIDSGNIRREIVSSFDEWADELWRAGKSAFKMAAVRDSETLNILYPESDARFFKIKITSAGRPIGWAVMLATQMKSHKHFGAMKLGSIVDCMALPRMETEIIYEASKLLIEQDVDLIVTNQAHRGWCRALEQCRFLNGPSNFIFFASPELAKKLHPFEQNRYKIHINRADGGGPINL